MIPSIHINNNYEQLVLLEPDISDDENREQTGGSGGRIFKHIRQQQSSIISPLALHRENTSSIPKCPPDNNISQRKVRKSVSFRGHTVDNEKPLTHSDWTHSDTTSFRPTSDSKRNEKITTNGPTLNVKKTRSGGVAEKKVQQISLDLLFTNDDHEHVIHRIKEGHLYKDKESSTNKLISDENAQEILSFLSKRSNNTDIDFITTLFKIELDGHDMNAALREGNPLPLIFLKEFCRREIPGLFPQTKEDRGDVISLVLQELNSVKKDHQVSTLSQPTLLKKRQLGQAQEVMSDITRRLFLLIQDHAIFHATAKCRYLLKEIFLLFVEAYEKHYQIEDSSETSTMTDPGDTNLMHEKAVKEAKSLFCSIFFFRLVSSDLFPMTMDPKHSESKRAKVIKLFSKGITHIANQSHVHTHTPDQDDFNLSYINRLVDELKEPVQLFCSRMTGCD